MDMVVLGLSGILGIISLVCLIVVWVKLFQFGQTALGILCIVLSFCGIGILISYVVGWAYSRRMNLQPVMIAWTACILIDIILYVLFPQALTFQFQTKEITV